MPDNQQQDQQQDQEQKQETKPVKWEDFIKGQPAEIVAAYEAHTGGLTTALASERTQRGDLEKQLRDMAGKAAKGSEDEKRLTEMADRLNASQRQAEFYDEAHTKGVTSLRLAYLAAQDANLIDQKGRVNWDELKTKHPELFGGTTPPPGNAGAGTGNKPGGAASMDNFIRRSAGRQV
jgi:hypothetical protein